MKGETEEGAGSPRGLCSHGAEQLSLSPRTLREGATPAPSAGKKPRVHNPRVGNGRHGRDLGISRRARPLEPPEPRFKAGDVPGAFSRAGGSL